MAEETQTAYATSQWSDPVNIAAILQTIVGLVALPEVAALIPLKWMPLILAISGASAFILRTRFGKHPVTNIAPAMPITIPTTIETEKILPKKNGTLEYMIVFFARMTFRESPPEIT